MKLTAEEFIREKAKGKNCTDEEWEDFKLNHKGKLWVGFAIKTMEEFILQFEDDNGRANYYAFIVEGKARPDVKVIATTMKNDCKYYILENGKGERGIFLGNSDNYWLTAAWVGMEKDFGLPTDNKNTELDNTDKKLHIFDVRTRNFMIRDRARLMLEACTTLGKRDTEWEKEYFKGIQTLVDDIMKLTE